MRKSFFSTRRLSTFGVGALLAIVLSLTLGGAQAQSGTLTLDWWTINAGGTVASVSDSYTLSSTIGQPVVGPPADGVALTLESGFWERTAYMVYLPVVVPEAASPQANQP